MRILVFSTDDFLPPAGGAEIAFGQIAKRCPDISFDLVCGRLRPGVSRRQQIGNVTIHRVGIGIPAIDHLLLVVLGAPVGLLLHRKHRFDLVWSILASYGGFAATAVKRITGLPFLLTLQEGTNTDRIERRAWWFRPVFRAIFTSADGLQAISQYLMAWGLRMGFHGKIAKVIPNGVDVDAFSATLDASARTAQRTRWGAGPDDTVIISVSRFVPKNGMEDLVAALALMPKHVRLVLCGDGPLRESLKAQAHQLGLDGRITWEGFARHDDLPPLLAAADIFIRPSLSEGLGNAFLEAMAAGLMTVGTPVGGIIDFLTDGETGFFCRPGDPDSIVQAVERILSLGAAEREHIRTRARAMVSERFTWDHISAGMKHMFHTLCPRPR